MEFQKIHNQNVLNCYNCLCNSLLSMSFASLTVGALLSSREVTDPELINEEEPASHSSVRSQPFRFPHLQFNVLQHKLSVFLLFRFNCTYLWFQNKIFLREPCEDFELPTCRGL